MGYLSSLQEAIDLARKKQAEEAAAKQKAVDAARKAALAQAANLPKAAPMQGPTMAGPSLAQAGQPPAPAPFFDASQLAPPIAAPKSTPVPVTTKIAKPAKPAFIDLSPELAQPVAPLQPPPMQGPPRPIDDPNDPVHNALNRWRQSDQPDILGSLTKYKVQPYRPPQLDNGFGGTGTPDLGATGTIGGNTFPSSTFPTTGNGEPGTTQPNQFINLASWKPQQGPTTTGGWLNDTVNKGLSYVPQGDPSNALNGWVNTKPAEQEYQANLDKIWKGVGPGFNAQVPWAVAQSTMAGASEGRRLVENTRVPFTNLDVGQVLSATGQAFNRGANPLSEGFHKDFGQGPASQKLMDFAKQEPGAVNFLPLTEAWDNLTGNLQKAQAVNNYVKSLPPDQQNKVQIALTNIASGPERTRQTIDDILNQDKNAANYTQQAQAALAKSQDMTLPVEQRNQFALQAAQYGKQANDEKNYSALDYVDKNRNPWADMAMSLVTDPIQYLPIDKAVEGWKAARTAKIFDVSPEEAMKFLPKALEDAQKILGKVATQDASKLVDAGAPKIAPLAATTWERINPFALTPETKAQQATSKLWNAASNLIGNVSTKQDARLLIQTWIDNPTKLIEGLTGLTSPTAKAVSNEGALQVGAGVIANKPLLDAMPILQSARDALTKLESLAGEGAFNPAHLASELDNVFYDSARQMYGMDGLAVPKNLSAATKKAYDLAKDANIAAGSVKPVLRRLSDGTGVIDFVATGANQVKKAMFDEAGKLISPGYGLTAETGKVIASSTPEIFANAEASFKALKEAGKASGGIAKTAGLAWGLQRAILSDMYLTLNPGHWVRNAASATATLLTDHNYSTRNQAEMVSELTSKLGMIPNRELQGAVAGTAEQIPHWTERFAPGNPYAKLVNAAQDVWGGLTTIGGVVPFGEESFRLTGFHTAFQRMFRNAWRKPVEGEFAKGLQALGVDPSLAKSITQHVIDAGIGGSKADIANTAREVLSGATIRQGLREIGVPDELLSMGGWGKLKDVLGGHLPEQADEAAQAVRGIFTDELVAKGQILNDAPPQMGNYKWSEIELAHDNAALIDTLREAGKQAGLPADQVETTVQQLAKGLEESMTGAWDKLRGDLAGAPNPQEALNHALDTWARHTQMKEAARASVDELGRNAVGAQTKEMWAKKWQDTQGIVDKLTQDTGALFADARARMNGVSQDTKPIYDWWQAIDRYINYDESAVNAARTEGMGLGAATTDNADQFSKAISANRAYVDKHTLELYDAFRRHPTQESFDMLVNAQKHIDDMGASAAHYLKEQRELLFDKKISLDKYHQIRNQTWGQFADNAVIHNKATQRYIVADGVTSKFKEALSWDDPFYGRMRVVAPDASNPGRYMVMGDDGKMQSVAASYIPNEVRDAWDKIVNHDEVVDSVMADIGKTTPPAPAQAVIPQGPAGPVDNPNKGGVVGVRRTEAGDEPVSILGKSHTDENGIDHYSVGGTPEKVPVDQLHVLSNDNRLYKMSDVGELKNSRQAIDLHSENIGGLEEGRRVMRAEWDRTAKAGKQYLSLDAAVASYNRKGIVRLPENKFEDLIGETIAGHRLETQSDVERFVQEYVDLRAKIQEAKTGISQASEQYKTIRSTAEHAQNPEQIREALKWDPYKLEPGETVEKVLADNTTKSKSINGMKAPEMGEVLGSHMIEKLKAAERTILDQLPELLQGKPNQLTEAQRLGAIDLLNKILPHFDNAVATASKGATDATDFAMLNFNNRRNFDSILGMIFPYHYFWTRSAANWAQRVLSKPGVLIKYYNLEKNIELENKQQNLPSRLQGTIPNPVNQLGIGPPRLGNPFTWILPFSGYYPNQYVNPEEATTDYEKWIMRVKQFTPGLMPAAQAAMDYGLDQLSPKPDGSKRFNAADYAPQKFIPAIDLAGYAYQAATGQSAPKYPGTDIPIWGDKFDSYRTGRKAPENAASGQTDQATAQYAQQIAYNKDRNLPMYDKIPAEYQKSAYAEYMKANAGAAQDRLWAKAGTFFLGNAGYGYSPEEQKMQQETATAPKLGYNEWSNPFGSKQAMTEYKAQHPELQSWATKSALVPSTDATYQPMEPAISAQNTAKNSAKDAIQADMSKATEQYLQQHPEATTKEVMALKQPYLDKIKALDQQYPDAGYPEGNGNVPRGLNPQERAQWQLDQIIYGSAAGAPQRPPDGATPEQLQAYYKAKADFVQKQLDSIETQGNNAFADQGEPNSAWLQAFKQLTQGKYAIDLLHDAYLKDASQTEKDWSQRNELKQELTAAQMAQANAGIEQRLGAPVAALWQQYLQLPKEGTERQAFKAQHPELSLASIAAYNPDQYDAVVKQFGGNAWTVYAKRPAFPGDNATEAQKATYKAQMQAYEKANPSYSAIKLWVDGRPRKFETAPTGMIAQRNFGQDYQQAMKIFGPKIFSVVANYPSNADKKTKALYYKAHPELSGYYQWYNEVKDQPPTYVPLSQDAGGISPSLANYTGPRPIGSDRQPIGQPLGAEPVKQQWDLSVLSGGDQSKQGAATGQQQGASKTAAQYAAESDKDYQQKFYKQHGYHPGHSPKALAYATARASLNTEFGGDAVKIWEAYGKLPKGSKAREDYKAAHPELRAYDMAAYNPKEYALAKQQFGDQAWMEWANVPAYAATPEAQAARQQYFDQHPTAKLMNAWVNGRPSAQGDQLPGEGFKYNFGADYASAQKQFGDNIWDLYAQYSTGWDKGKKKDFLTKNPQFTAFMNWWYGSSPNGATSSQRGAPGGHPAGGGAFHGYGGGGGYSAPHKGTGSAFAAIQHVQPTYMNQGLNVSERDLQQLRQWRPHNIDLSWMKAGAEVGPENLKKWRK